MNDDELRKKMLEGRERKRLALLEENMSKGLWPKTRDDQGPNPLW